MIRDLICQWLGLVPNTESARRSIEAYRMGFEAGQSPFFAVTQPIKPAPKNDWALPHKAQPEKPRPTVLTHTVVVPQGSPFEGGFSPDKDVIQAMLAGGHTRSKFLKDYPRYSNLTEYQVHVISENRILKAERQEAQKAVDSLTSQINKPKETKKARRHRKGKDK